MDKKLFITVLRRLHLATREYVGVEAIWRIMSIATLVLFVLLIGGAWYLFTWASTETLVVNQLKPIMVTITDDELNKVEADVSQRNSHYEAVLSGSPDGAALSGNTVEPTSTATTTPK